MAKTSVKPVHTPAAEADVKQQGTPQHIRRWIVANHDEARRALRNGPGGQGWRHNESKRKEAEELETFLSNLRRAAGEPS